jgi:ubiquinone/menaquinone biosynthesis C-methylase UbiE
VQDSIKPVASAGEPASSFPAPSRQVASIVAPRWTDEDDRDDAGEFARVARIAGVRNGMTVADIGAGDGYYVARLSPMVGANGRVYGEDIIASYLTILDKRVRSTPLANVTVALGETHDPRLPTAALDLAFMIHMYHEIEQPYALLWNLATSMKPSGRLVILDLERQTFSHGTPIALLRCELRAVGYRERTVTKSGTEEYVAVFDAPVERPTPATVRTQVTASPCRTSR